MKGKMNYKTKRNIIIATVVLVLFIIASVSTYVYIRGNNDTQAVSQLNSTSENRNGEEQSIGEQDNNNEQSTVSSEETNTVEENVEVSDNTEENQETTETTATITDNVRTSESVTSNNNTENTLNQTQTIETTETYETSDTIVGFVPANIDLGLMELNANLPNLSNNIEAVTEMDNNYVVTGDEITYNIVIKNNNEEALQQIDVSAVIPEGTELVEGTISDNGIVENGKISWVIDIDTEKTVSFTVKVTNTSGNIDAEAIVNGVTTNTVTNIIDEAPVLTVIDPNRYEMEIGTEYKEKGYSAIDTEDGDITDKVVLSYRFLPAGSSNWTDPTEMDINLLGTYKITYTVTDSRGNTAQGTRVVQIVDTQAPEIIVKDGYVGNKDKNVYSNVSFKLHDNHGVASYKINDGEYINVTVSQWSELNFNDIISSLVEGKNTITLKDVAGNETTYEFTYDTTAPSRVSTDYYVINKTANVEGNYQFFYIGNGNKINLNIKFKEELSKVPTFTIIDSNGVEYVLDGHYDGLDDKGSHTYSASFTIADDESKLAQGELNFIISEIYDIAGNKAEDVTETTNGRRIIYDITAPVISIEKTEGFTVGTEPYFSKVSFKFYDNIAVKEYEINGNIVPLAKSVWSNANFENFAQFVKEGENTIKLRDMVGNEIEYKFYFDNTPAVRSATNILVYGDKNENTEFYAKIGDTIQTYISFDEKLAHNPTFILINDGKEYKMDASLVTAQEPNKDGKYIYQVLYKIEENTQFVDGEITLRVTDLEDMYGNKIADETKPTNGHKVYFDKTAPELERLQIINNNNPESGYIKDGETVRINATFNEELGTLPTLTIGNQTAEFKQIEGGNGEVIYQANLVIDSSKNTELEEGKITFTISGYADKAGNIGTDITEESAQNSLIFDKTIPVATFVKIQNSKEPNTTWVKQGEEVWVYVIINEELSVEPTFTIAGKEVPIIQRENGKPWGQGWYKYAALLEMTEDIAEGNVEFKVSGYADLAGNIGADITDTTDGSKIVYDRTAPQIKINADKNVSIEAGIDEYVEMGATVTDNGKEIMTDLQPEVIHYSINGEFQGEVDKVDTTKLGTYKLVYKYTDAAGNVGVDADRADHEYAMRVVTVQDTIAPEVSVEYNITSPTKKSVTVRLHTNEPITIDDTDWVQENELQYKKVYRTNTEQEIIVKDKAGNTSIVKIRINNIDKTAPDAEITYSNNNGAAMTNQDVTVTLVATEPIKDIDGWTKVDDKTFTKVYSENGKYSVVIEDLVGNTAEIKYEVKRIDKVAPVITLPTKNTFEVGVDVYTYPEAGSVYDEFDKEISFSKVNIQWFKANADGSKGEQVENFEWNTTLANRELGKYYIEYWVSDKAGNIATAHRILTLQDTTAPTITMNGEVEMQVNQGTEFSDPGATAKDNYDTNPILNTVVYYSETGKDGTWTTVDKVDTSVLGYYNIWYSAQDAQGNKSEAVRRTVRVIDGRKPEVTIEYSTKDIAQSVTVTLTSNKPITFIDSGTWKSNGNVHKKVYYYNGDQTVKFVDEYGNEGSIVVSINNIDRDAPKATITQRIDQDDEDKIWVIFEFDEKIDESTLPQGITKSEDKENTYVKAYFSERDINFTVKDLAGNETNIQYTIQK